MDVTAQIARAGQLKAASAEGGSMSSEKAYVNEKYTDKSPFAVFRGLTSSVSRKLYFSHNQVIILGMDQAKEDVSEALDLFLRGI